MCAPEIWEWKLLFEISKMIKAYFLTDLWLNYNMRLWFLLDIASWEAKAKIPLGLQLIRQILVVLGGLVSRQSTQSVDANTVYVTVYYFCGKSHLCITVLWRMSKDKWRLGKGRVSTGKWACDIWEFVRCCWEARRKGWYRRERGREAARNTVQHRCLLQNNLSGNIIRFYFML